MKVKQLQLFCVTVFLCSFPTLVVASQAVSTPRVSTPIALSARSLLVAQAFLDDRCPDSYVYLLGETSNYRVIICGDRSTGQPTHYLGVSKRSNSSILLPLSAYTRTRFFARNGGHTYTLDLNSQTLTIGIPGSRARVERFTAETP